MPVRVHMDDMGRMVNRKTKTDKTKTDTNPIPDPNRYRRSCPDPILNYKLRLRPVLSILPKPWASFSHPAAMWSYIVLYKAACCVPWPTQPSILPRSVNE